VADFGIGYRSGVSKTDVFETILESSPQEDSGDIVAGCSGCELQLFSHSGLGTYNREARSKEGVLHS
jgi:hypothetical protein